MALGGRPQPSVLTLLPSSVYPTASHAGVHTHTHWHLWLQWLPTSKMKSYFCFQITDCQSNKWICSHQRREIDVLFSNFNLFSCEGRCLVGLPLTQLFSTILLAIRQWDVATVCEKGLIFHLSLPLLENVVKSRLKPSVRCAAPTCTRMVWNGPDASFWLQTLCLFWFLSASEASEKASEHVYMCKYCYCTCTYDTYIKLINNKLSVSSSCKENKIFSSTSSQRLKTLIRVSASQKGYCIKELWNRWLWPRQNNSSLPEMQQRTTIDFIQKLIFYSFQRYGTAKLQANVYDSKILQQSDKKIPTHNRGPLW